MSVRPARHGVEAGGPLSEITVVKNGVTILLRRNEDGSGIAYWIEDEHRPDRYMEARVDDVAVYYRALILRGWKRVRT